MAGREQSNWRVTAAHLAVLAAVCVIFIWLRWKKMDSLVMLDTARWLNEALRVSRGELPYRDFSWQYPPLSIFLMGWALRWFGATFTVVQVLLDVLGIIIVLLSYLVARYLFPRSLQLIAVTLLIVVGATSVTQYALFSLLIYTPAILTGTIGLMVLLLGLLRACRAGELRVSSVVLIIVGFTVSALSKPESAIASTAVVIVFAILDRRSRPAEERAKWLSRHSWLLASCLLPPVLGYAWVASRVGFANLTAGIGAYGMASVSCPWWPTGLGMSVMAASIAEICFAAACVSLLKRHEFSHALGGRYRVLLICGGAGMVFYVAWIVSQNFGMLTDRNVSIAEKLHQLTPQTVWLNPLLMPVMWLCIAVWLNQMRSYLSLAETPVGRIGGEATLLVTLPVAMTPRFLFSHHIVAPSPQVLGMCYPFLLMLAPYFAWRFLALAEAVNGALRGLRSTTIVGLVVLIYVTARLGATYPGVLSDRAFDSLATRAGVVKLSQHDLNASIYRYVLDTTAPADMVLDIPYGGGINFASGRPSPIFNTMFWYLPVPRFYEELDLAKFLEHPPKVVIAQDAKNYGTEWGVHANVKCPCPRLVWVPDKPSWDPNKVFLIVSFIQQHYRVDRKIGDRLLLVPNGQ